MAHYTTGHSCQTCANGVLLSNRLNQIETSLVLGKEARAQLLKQFKDVPRTHVLCCESPFGAWLETGPNIAVFPPIHWCAKHLTQEEWDKKHYALRPLL